MIRTPTHGSPAHPGEILLKEFLEPMGITQRYLADAIHVPYQRVNELINGKRGITPSTALRLAKFFGNSPDFWLNLQLKLELYYAEREEEEELASINVWQNGSESSKGKRVFGSAKGLIMSDDFDEPLEDFKHY